MLSDGHRLRDDDNQEVVVRDMLGAGGQGEVYRVETRQGDRALKWYYPQLATEMQRDILVGLVHRKTPDERFLWPLSMAADPSGRLPGFGYLMEIRSGRFHDLPSLLRRDVAGVTFRSLVTAALHTAEAYQALHKQGIAYRDINWGNIFFDPTNGDVKICDNDNAVYEGEEAGVAGTMDFMAPELVRGDPGAKPSILTDLHSLAVLLFLVLMNHQPFSGALELGIRCLDDKAKKRLLGTDPVFVFHPTDLRNRPDPHEQATVVKLWECQPASVRKLFVRTFTEGIVQPGRRTRETEWRQVLSAVLDAIADCPSCGVQNLVEPGAAAPRCWRCGTVIPPGATLVVTSGRGAPTRRRLRIGVGAKVYAHHLVEEPDRHDFGAVVGMVSAHPKTPGLFGLTNHTAHEWTVRRPDGNTVAVPPGRSAALKPGLLVEFGNSAVGEFENG